ncbi:uncharacterized protein CBL_20960, partial [Carabus blaptoides fortunei]
AMLNFQDDCIILGGKRFNMIEYDNLDVSENLYVRGTREEISKKNFGNLLKKNVLQEVTGNLFDASSDCSLVTECRGIAVRFRKIFGGIQDLRKHCSAALSGLKTHCLQNVSKLAMPRVGCDLDKLSWQDLKEILNDIFQDSNIQVIVYNLNRKFLINIIKKCHQFSNVHENRAEVETQVKEEYNQETTGNHQLSSLRPIMKTRKDDEIFGRFPVRIQEILDIPPRSQFVCQAVQEIWKQYSMLQDSKLGCTHEVRHRIITEDIPPITENPYRVPYNQRIERKKLMSDILEQSIITELGHKVFLHDPAAKIGLSKKLIKPWEGPYCIAEILGPFTYRITEIEGKRKNNSEEQEEDRDEENDNDTNDFRPLIPAETSIPPSSRHQNSLNENEDQNETFKVIEHPQETTEEHEYIDEVSENLHCPTSELTNETELEAGTTENVRELHRRAKTRNKDADEKDYRTVPSLLANGVIGYVMEMTQCDEIVVLGDFNQIPFIDRDHVCKMTYERMDKFTSVKKNMNISYRIPVDVASALKDIYKRLCTKNTQVQSMRTQAYSGTNIEPAEKTLYLVHLQSDKDDLIRNGFAKPAKTLNLSVYQSREHAVVAVSRHTKSFVYYTDVDSDPIANFVKNARSVGYDALKDWNDKMTVMLTPVGYIPGDCVLESSSNAQSKELIRCLPTSEHIPMRVKQVSKDISDWVIKKEYRRVKFDRAVEYLQEYYDDKMPGVSKHMYKNDQEIVEMSDIGVNIDKLKLIVGKGPYMKPKYDCLNPKLRTLMSAVRVTSQRECVLAAAKRNLNAPVILNEELSADAI